MPASLPIPRPLEFNHVGDIRYRGNHTWRGVLVVGSNNIGFSDGRVVAEPGGIPEGITFEGNRRGIGFRNLTFDGVGDGIVIGNDQSVDYLTIDNCRFINCRTPDVTSHDHMLGSRGYGFFGAKGHNWIITNSTFQTRCKGADESDRNCFSVQYATRLGHVHGLKVSDCTFENRNGKASIWLMFVHDAVFENCRIVGGRFVIGARPGDMADVSRGDCRNIVFRNCTFDFGVYDDWPASMLVYPGSANIRFEGCTFNTSGDWWLEVDSRDVVNVRWDSNCSWNGRRIEEYLGVRSSMSIEEMSAKDISPARGTWSRVDDPPAP